MHLPLLNLSFTLSEIDSGRWSETYKNKFNLFYEKLLTDKNEYDKLQTFIEKWLVFCIDDMNEGNFIKENKYANFDAQLKFTRHDIHVYVSVDHE